MKRDRLLSSLCVAVALGVGLFMLQRWVAQTRLVAMALVAGWFLVVGIVTLLVVRRRPELRGPALGTFVAIAIASAGIGYWTAFRDREVHEDVVVATRVATVQEREEGLAVQPQAPVRRRPARPIRLAAGTITGQDGHHATGRAAIVREPDGRRRLTLTGLDADPGPQVVVYLARDTEHVDDVIKLGALKGNVGDQQYRIPDGADLRGYDAVILWCVVFTTRIATAPLA